MTTTDKTAPADAAPGATSGDTPAPAGAPAGADSSKVTILSNVPIPPRSRTFSDEDARNVLTYLRGEGEGQDGKPAENVGFGTFDTPGAARSAGNTLNRLLLAHGAPHKYAITTFSRDGKTVGVVLNKKAKARKGEKGENGDTPAAKDAPKGDAAKAKASK